MTTLLLSNNIKEAKTRHTAIVRQIAEGKNLIDLLREVNEAISTVDESIVRAILEERQRTQLETLKNELWSLKFQILERTN